MFKAKIKSAIIILIALCMPCVAIADVPNWQIVPGASSLKFTATQNGSPLVGEFKNFTAVIGYDPDQLDKSAVNVTVDMNSVTTTVSEIADTLKGSDWFKVSQFPQATFQSTTFTKTGDNAYTVAGALTILDKTAPVTFNVTQLEYSGSKVSIKGSAVIKRLAFGIGAGTWSDTTAVKDDVSIDFTIVATKQ